jgi:AAA+ ATPase superfamily predicted ATPase
MFYGREIERKKLCTMFQTDGQMISLIYGRRRIGKSVVLNIAFFLLFSNQLQIYTFQCLI